MNAFERKITRRSALAAVAAGLAAAAGCGGGASPGASESGTGRFGPHGGPLVALPGEKGFAEVLSEPVKAKKASLDARVVVYFLKPDLKAPLSGTPTDVVVKLRTPDAATPEAVAVTPDPKGAGRDDLAGGRFASAVGPYSVDQLIGELSATVDGRPFVGEFFSPR